MLAIFNRHPRYVYLLVGILVCTAFLLTTGRPEPPRLAWGGDRALKRTLREEDVRYDQNLRARQDLVRKWGPTDDRVAAFPEPSTGYFYTLWDFFLPAYRCPHTVERVGTMGDGGKWVCGMDRVARQRRPCAIYSFGVNGESSFEAELLERLPQCEVWGYDFSVKSFGPEVAANPALKGRSHFFPYALGKEDKPYGNPPTYTLQTLMQQNGHDFIDILKIDIEGAEFESLDAFLDVFEAQHGAFSSDAHPHGPSHEPALPIGQMQIEIHAWGAWGAESFPRFRQWWERLERAGLRPFFTEPNLVYVNLVRGSRPTLSEYAFMNIRGHHALVSDGY